MIIKFKAFKEKNLICGVSDRTLGNIDFRFGEEKKVLTNRKKLVKVLGIDLKNLYEMEQIHGSNIKILRNEEMKKLRDNIVPQTDGLITSKLGIFLMVKTADCFPVMIYDPKKKVVAAVHVGWRGAVEKIFLEAILKMMEEFGSDPGDLKVGIGPGARKCCFIHNHYIQEKLPEWKNYIRQVESGKTLDMPSFIMDKLISVGVKKKNIEDSGICTVCNQNFFSHFRSLKKGKPESRFASVIGLKE